MDNLETELSSSFFYIFLKFKEGFLSEAYSLFSAPIFTGADHNTVANIWNA